jgi:hypothetical protein
VIYLNWRAKVKQYEENVLSVFKNAESIEKINGRVAQVGWSLAVISCSERRLIKKLYSHHTLLHSLVVTRTLNVIIVGVPVTTS